jgi:hypothetical protein
MLVEDQARSEGPPPSPRPARERKPANVEDRREATGTVQTTEREDDEDTEDDDVSDWEARRG